MVVKENPPQLLDDIQTVFALPPVMVIPLDTRCTTNDTVIRIPRIHARPPITCGSKGIRSNPSIAPPMFSHSSLALETSKQTRVLCHVFPAVHQCSLSSRTPAVSRAQ